MSHKGQKKLITFSSQGHPLQHLYGISRGKTILKADGPLGVILKHSILVR